jgi:hypothetical protein
MSLSVMQELGTECTRHYETCEIIYAIDSRKVLAYGEIKYFCAWISAAPHMTIVFTIVVVDVGHIDVLSLMSTTDVFTLY